MEFLKTHRRMDVVTESHPEGLVLLSGEEVVYLNSAAEKILGLSQGHSIHSGEYAELTPAAQALFQAISESLPVEFVQDSKDHESRYLLRTFPLANQTLVWFQDVTLERREQEERAKSLAILSHQVRTPVTSLTLAVRLLKKNLNQFPDESHRNLIQTCVAEVDRLRVLLEELLEVVRLDSQPNPAKGAHRGACPSCR